MTRSPANKSSRGGGPKTTEGKKITSRNALKTGVYSAQEILPGEHPEEFAQLESFFIDDFKPQGITESSLVHELTLLAWKKIRLERIENHFLTTILNAPAKAEEFHEVGFPKHAGQEWLLNDLTVLTEEFITRNAKELVILKKIQKIEHLNEFLLTAEQDHPHLYRRIQDAIYNPTVEEGSNVIVVRVIDSTLGGEDIKPVSALAADKVLKFLMEESEAVQYIKNNIGRLEDCVPMIRNVRLKKFMESPGPTRAYQDLSRAFFKVLDELRKQQGWRYQRDIALAQTPMLGNKKSSH